ncbi:GOLPH3/VPS74 family protein [Pseudonocardia sp.]|uniref:GOLPH3/VPS74 family protein n=1 Tax=Pseudonocardia sp. TaxID=60912 RepID=UPI003D0BAA2D
MLIAEDLLLLLTDDTTGALSKSGSETDTALAGALLVELAILGRVDVTGSGRLTVHDPAPTGDALLDAALARLREREGAKPKNVLGKLAKGLRGELYDQLAGRGVLRAERRRVVGVWPVRRWPAADGAHEATVRADLRSVLLEGRDPDERTGALVALLHAIRAVRVGVDARQHGASRRDVARRAKEVAEGSWGSAAVRKAVDEMTAAVTVAVVAAGVAGGSG